MKLSDLATPIIEVYKSPIYGCKKPTLRLNYADSDDHFGGNIKLATFVNKETAELFAEYFEDIGITIDVFDFGEGEENAV